MGGNLPVAMSDPEVSFAAMRKLDLAVHIATKLNRSHLLLAKTSIILPCLGPHRARRAGDGPAIRDGRGFDVGGARVGRSAASRPRPISNPSPPSSPASPRRRCPTPRSTGTASSPTTTVIRDAIEKVFPAFADFNERVSRAGRLPASHCRLRARMADAERQGQLHRLRRARLRYARRRSRKR